MLELSGVLDQLEAEWEQLDSGSFSSPQELNTQLEKVQVKKEREGGRKRQKGTFDTSSYCHVVTISDAEEKTECCNGSIDLEHHRTSKSTTEINS